MHIIILIIINMLTVAQVAECQAELFGVALIPAPVLNSPDFGSVFGQKEHDSLKTDRCGQVRELEYIALPGTVFKIMAELKRDSAIIYQVVTEEYPVPRGIRLYIDSRFLELRSNAPIARKRTLPPHRQIVATLMSAVGSRYVWGGNVQQGVPELLDYFYENIGSSERERFTLAGLDCSGLLYSATDGWTPRNTSQLLSFGLPVAIKGKKTEEIVRLLEPLDLIVWNGHAIIVLDRETAIESRLECGKPSGGGVVTTSLQKRLIDILRKRKPVDSWPIAGKKQNVFVVRRWYGMQGLPP